MSLTRPTGDGGDGRRRRRRVGGAPSRPVRGVVRRHALLVRPHGALAPPARSSGSRSSSTTGGRPPTTRSARRSSRSRRRTSSARTGSARSPAMTRAVTTDPAMLLFLNGIENRKGAINENYGRELMELFTLGADRGAYTETDVREISRGAERLGRRLGRRDGLARTSASTAGALGRRRPRPSSARPARSAGRTPAGSSLEHPLHASFFVAKLWSYFIPVPPSAGVAGQARGSSTSSSGHQIRPVVEAILCSPEFYEGPRMVKPPVVLAAGPAARARQADHRRALGLAERRRRPAPLLPAGRRRAGTTSAGWTRTRSARAGRSSTTRCEGRARSTRATPYPAETRRPGARQGARVLGRPGADRRDGRVAEAVRRVLRAEPARAGSARQRQNALRQLDRRLPRLPDLLRTVP